MSREPLAPSIGFLRVASLIVLAVGALTLHRALTTPEFVAQHPAVGIVLPEVTLTMLKAPPSMDAATAGPLLLDFWALDCVPCRRARPGLAHVVDRLADLDVIALSVNIDPPLTTTDRLAQYVETTTFRGAVVRDEGALQRSLAVRATPTVVLTGEDRRVLAVWSGRLDPERIEAEARSLLTGAP